MLDAAALKLKVKAAQACEHQTKLNAAFEALRSLKRSIESIPDPEICSICGGPTRKVVIDYDYLYKATADTRIILTKALPGYRCDACDLEYRDRQLSDAFLRTIADAFASKGDTTLQEDLASSRASVFELLHESKQTTGLRE